MKVFEDGAFVDAQQPETSARGAATRTDPLSKSLQDWQLKKMNQSEAAAAANRKRGNNDEQAKCVFDERMFQV